MPIAPVSPDGLLPKRQRRSFAICSRRIFRGCGNSATRRQVTDFTSFQKEKAKNYGVTVSCQIYVYCRGAHHWVGTLSSREAVLPLMYCVKEDGLHLSGQYCRPSNGISKRNR